MVLDELARRFPQLYVEPADDAGEAYRIAALRGAGPEGATLDHFRGAGDDFLRAYDTPAGQVDVLFLALRLDFERALRCLAFRCRPEEIPATTGAMTISGLADWSKIAAERERARAAGEDWPDAFRAFTADPANYRTTLVVASEGPYSAVDASLTPYDADEWIAVSRQIRIFHELAHVVCIRLMAGDRLAIYDELTADFCGLVHATGTYDTHLAARFLGVDGRGYAGGRLENYLKDGCRDIDEVAREAYGAIRKMAEVAEGVTPKTAFEHTLDLKRRRLLDY